MSSNRSALPVNSYTLKKLKWIRIFLIAAIAGLGALALGNTLPLTPRQHLPFAWSPPRQQPWLEEALTLLPPSDGIARVVAMPMDSRFEVLQSLIGSGNPEDRHRARYLLATDYLAQGEWQQAITALTGLETTYSVLGAYVIYQRARAYQVGQQRDLEQATWQTLITGYPNHPLTVEALYRLGYNKPAYWDRAIAQFPAHPRTVEIVEQRLHQQPDNLSYQLLLARYGLHRPNILVVLDRLVQNHADQLTPAAWETIGFAYWEKQIYVQAGPAYARSPKNPENLYRAARGLQRGQQKELAREHYRQLVEDFPATPEAATALLRLQEMAPTDAAALPYLEQLLAQFPERAGEALQQQVRALERMGQNQTAQDIRQELLERYSSAPEAAELRWQYAWEAGLRQDWSTARFWAQQILAKNPEADLAPQAAFWAGRWAEAQGEHERARASLKYTLEHYPASYYAWRAAQRLGLEVGNFATVRHQQPSVQPPLRRSLLPAGSPVLRELYLLGQDQAAWELWQVEFLNRMTPTVPEQFTDGLMRLGVGENLDGLYMVSSLAWRDTPDARSDYQALRQQLRFWQALYPFPFEQAIARWSRERDLNPLLVTALIRQESRFEPRIRSAVGAVGLMQVMPETGDWIANKLALSDFNLDEPEDNLKLGTWYLDFTHQEHDNNAMLAVASYNAGPGNVAIWIDRFGLEDPDWFVEQIPFPETRNYVKSVFASYWNYLQLYDLNTARLVAQYSSARAQFIH